MNLESDVADAPIIVSKTKNDILAEIEILQGQQEKIDKLYHFIKHGDHETKEHAWSILEDIYDDHVAKDIRVEASRIMAVKKSSKEN